MRDFVITLRNAMQLFVCAWNKHKSIAANNLVRLSTELYLCDLFCPVHFPSMQIFV